MKTEDTRSALSRPTGPRPWPWPLPPWVAGLTFPPEPGGPWLVASAGDLHGRFVRRFSKEAKAVQGDRRAAMAANVEELEHLGGRLRASEVLRAGPDDTGEAIADETILDATVAKRCPICKPEEVLVT